MLPGKCMSSGGNCVEATWKPTYKDLQDALATVTVNPQSSADLKTNKECEERTDGDCGMVMCAKKRSAGAWWGTLATIHLGLDADVRSFAAKAIAWHWYPNKLSPYTNTAWQNFVSFASSDLTMSENDCSLKANQASEPSCCIGEGTSRWEVFLSRLNTFRDGAYKFNKDGTLFTYIITAPRKSADIEWRIARSESRFNTKVINVMYDVQSKHGYLADFRDYVLYAGEMWIQAKVGESPRADLAAENLMVVLNTDSGTFAPGADVEDRKVIQQMVMAGLRVDAGQVAVCPGRHPINAAMETHPGWDRRTAALSLILSEDDPCPEIMHLYAKYIAENSKKK